MGCGCGQNKAQRREERRKFKAEREGTLHRVKETIKTVWEKSQPDQPTHIIKRINKK